MSPSSFSRHTKNIFFSRRLIRTLVDRLKERPVAVNSATGFILCAGSDALAQQIEKQKQQVLIAGQQEEQPRKEGRHGPKEKESLSSMIISIDFHRFLSAGFIGILFGGFIYPAAYKRLDTIWKGTNFASVLKKSCVEIATVGIFVNCVSMTCRGLCTGGEKGVVVEHVVQEMPNVTLNDIRVWLPYNLIAFSCIPAYIRPITAAMMEAAWQTYISLVSNHHNHVCNDISSKNGNCVPRQNIHCYEEESDKDIEIRF